MTTDPTIGGDQARRRRILVTVRFALFGILANAAVWWLVRHGDELGPALRALPPWGVAAAFGPALLAAMLSLLAWRTALAEMGGERLPATAAARVFYLSQLGKYVPGSVWSLAIQSELNRAHDVPRRSSLATGVLVMSVAITTGLALGALTLPLVPALRSYWWVVLLLPPMLAALHPRVLSATANRLLRLVRRSALPRTPSWAGLLRLAGLQLAIWVCLGLVCWLLLVAGGAPAGPAALVAVGGYALAHSLGLLAVGLPAGAGVREAVVALALSTVVSTPTAVVVALAARAIMTVVDLLLAGGQYLARQPGVSAPAPPVPPTPEPGPGR